MKIAIVYDWLDKWGGVERLLLALHEIYPDADWYTSFYDENASVVQKIRLNTKNPQKKIRASFMQHLPGFIKRNRILSLPFFPFAFESMDLKAYDLVISVTSSFAKSVVTHPWTMHVCILLTPTRWLYSEKDNYELEMRNEKFFAPVSRWMRNVFMNWDQVAAQRPDHYIAISQTVAERCKKYYSRKAEVIYPPFDASYWKSLLKVKSPQNKQVPDSFYLVVSRLEPYKRVDIVIDAFKALPERKLIIVGSGSLLPSLQEKAGPNVMFLTNLDDVTLAHLYSQAEALIMPQEEDFGYVALEAQAVKCPVVAYGKGGVRETIIEGNTGTFFYEQSVEALREAVADFQHDTYNLGETNVMEKFSNKLFPKKLVEFISRYV